MEDMPAEKKVADLSALLEISRAMAAEKDIDALLDVIIHKTTGVMQAERSTLYLVDKETNELRTRIAEGLEIKEIRLPIGTGISGSVAATRELVNIRDPYDDPRFDQSWDEKTGFRTRSILCAPLVTHEDKVVGVVQVLNKMGGPFTAYDESLLLALASHAAIALDQAELIQHYVEKKKMAAALEVAREIQASVLPTESPWIEGFDIHGHCWPCDETGGDYYDFISLPNDKLGIAVGDVTGHGIGSALLMMASRSLLRAVVSVQPDLGESMTLVNDLLSEDVQEGMFLTLFYGALDPEKRTISFLSAGHEPGLLCRVNTGEIEQLQSGCPPMGVMVGMDFARPQTITLNKGDLLFLCTDGATEAGSPDFGELFGRERLHNMLLASLDKPAEQVVHAVNEAVRKFSGHLPLKDDLTLVAVRAT